MARLFDRNMFIMLLAIMVGVVVITFFIADIVNRSAIDDIRKEHEVEIDDINVKNEQFTSHFIDSTVGLDFARDHLANGDYHYDLAFLWYYSSLNEKNVTNLELYKERGIDNCSEALPDYLNSLGSFETAEDLFKETRNYTSYYRYLEILDLYINLTKSGANLTILKYNAIGKLNILIDNIIFDEQTGNITYKEDVSDILDSLAEDLELIKEEERKYDNCQSEIDEYPLFDEIR